MSVSTSFTCYTTFTILDKGQSYQQRHKSYPLHT